MRVLGLTLAAALALAGCEGCASEDDATPFCAARAEVTVTVPGAGPEAVEEALIPLERELAGIAGVRAVRSTAGRGRGVVELELEPEGDPARALEAARARVEAFGSRPGAGATLRATRSSTRRIAFVPADDPRAALGAGSIELTAVPAMLRAVGIDEVTLARRVRDELGDDRPTVDRLRQIRVANQRLEELATISEAPMPRVDGPDGAAAIAFDAGTAVTLHPCDGAPPLVGAVRARVQTPAGTPLEDRVRMAEALARVARDRGHAAYALHDLDLDAVLAGDPSVSRSGATEVVVLGDADAIAAAWREREVEGGSISVDARDVHRFVITVEEAQSGGVLARLATHSDVLEILPTPPAVERLDVEVDEEEAAARGVDPEEVRRAVRAAERRLPVVPGVTLRGPEVALDALTVTDADGAPVPVRAVATLARDFERARARADGRPVKRFEARIVPGADVEALRDHLLGR